jgi:hypothetical protein
MEVDGQVINSSHAQCRWRHNGRIPRGGHTPVNSVEVCDHFLLGEGFEGIETEATSLQCRASVRGNQLVVEFRGNGEFCRVVSILLLEIRCYQVIIPCREKSNSAGRSLEGLLW